MRFSERYPGFLASNYKTESRFQDSERLSKEVIMNKGKFIGVVCLSFAVLLVMAVNQSNANELRAREIQVAATDALCGGAYDCKTMPGTCCCLCGMNYGCMPRDECKQQPGCVCGKPIPMNEEGQESTTTEEQPNVQNE